MKSPRWPGLTVTLRSNGNDLTEYGVKTSDTAELDCSGYVESCAGQTFTVDVHIEPQYEFKHHDLAIDVYLDGTRIMTHLSKASMATRSVSIDGRASHDANGQVQLQQFTFAKLVRTEEGFATRTEGEINGIGSVVAKIRRVRVYDPVNFQTPHTLEGAHTFTISEKLLKGQALSNRAGLDIPVKANDFDFATADAPWGHRALATFTFNHRSLADLQIQGLIPKRTRTVPLEERDPASLTPDEARRALRIIRLDLAQKNRTMTAYKRVDRILHLLDDYREQTNVAIKRERGDDENAEDRGDSSTAREAGDRGGKCRRISNTVEMLITTIDISED